LLEGNPSALEYLTHGLLDCRINGLLQIKESGERKWGVNIL
jgi:hypothetical protein